MYTIKYVNRDLYLRRQEFKKTSVFVNNKLTGVFNDWTSSLGPRIVKDGYQTMIASNPDHSYQISHSQDASTPYYRAEAFMEPHRQTVMTIQKLDSVTAAYSEYSFYCTLNPWDWVERADDESLRDLALKRLKTRIQAQASYVPTIAPLVELREFRDLLRFLLNSGKSFVDALVKLRRTRGRSAVNFASDLWLNFNFAISPTISDAQNIAAKIAEMISDPGGHKYTVRGNAKKEWHSVKTISMPTSYYGGTCEVEITMHHKLSYRYVCGFKTVGRFANDYSAFAEFGLNPLAVLPALWELLPWSWLVDYFGTIGDFLDDEYHSTQVTNVYCVLTKRYTCDLVYKVKPTISGTVRAAWLTGPNSECFFTETRRMPLSAIPSRLIRFKTLDEIGKGAASKLANLASILGSGVKSSTTRRIRT